MAIDLSKIIQDGIGSTLTGLLGKDTTFKETTKVDNRDINNFEFLQVNSEFAFEKLTSLFEFFIPASSASIIFNTMMSAEDYDISSSIDDDTADAMTEFVSNLCGGLVTSFNAENIEELGTSKFNIQHKEIIKGSNISTLDNFFRFSIDIEENNVLVFIKFHEEFLPFIENITSSEVTYYPAEVENEKQEEENEKDTKETDTEKGSQDTPKEIENEEEKKPKTSKLNALMTKRNKILIGILSGIVILLLIVLIFGVSEEEKIVKEETNTTKAPVAQDNRTKTIEITPAKIIKKIDFSMKDIDVARLNTRLSTLTKYQVLSEKELRKQEEEEKLRLQRLQKEAELMAFAKKNKEEAVVIPKPQKSKEINTTMVKKEEEGNITKSKVPEPKAASSNAEKVDFYYLSTYSIKYALYKDTIVQSNSQNARISICNDKDGRTAIFMGPFDTDTKQIEIKNLIEKKDPTININSLKMTKEEFSQKCNF